MPTDRELPEPAYSHQVNRLAGPPIVVTGYTADQMRAYSDADNAALRANLTVACHQFGLEEQDNDTLRERVKALEDALQYAVGQVPELATVPGISAALGETK